MEIIKKFIKEEDGATIVEYALIVALIAIAVAITLIFVNQQLNAKFSEIANCISDSGNCPGGGGGGS
jgi:pilus assembly protein Flp/PilA